MEWFESLTGSESALETFYWLLALGSTGLLLLLSLLSALHSSIDWHIDFDTDHPGGELSWKAILVLLAVGGWTGVLTLKELPSLTWASPIFALVLGFSAFFLTLWILKKLKKLESSGTLQLENAIGKVGNIYLTIPENGTGQVQLSLQGRLVILDAISEEGVLPTGTQVLVYDVQGGKLVVTRYEEPNIEAIEEKNKAWQEGTQEIQ